MHPRADQADPSNAARWTWQFIVAVVLLVAFAALIAAMMLVAKGDDTVWQRRVYVFGAAQAIVFTAIGWLFGREVNRSTAESAKSDAAQAKQEAASARHEATEKTLEAAEAEKVAAEEKTKGRAVKALVRNGQSTAAAGRAGGPRDVGVTPTGLSPAAVLADLGALVDELYGE
jgi:4-amino-4-deoxy-L-arabinose transferase-like glycosyltransferase